MEIKLALLLSIWCTGLFIFILLKLPSKKGVIVSAILVFWVSIAYLGMQFGIKVVIANGIMMCFPRIVAYGYDMGSIILLSILFEISFTILQRKRDITSALISYGLVDAIQFMIFGLGI